jgi:segregation and condensation protein A
MEQPAGGQSYHIQLENYQGPLDLLLDLIRKQEIDIYDIPIARITGQYLEFLHRDIERLDTEVAGDFLLMAATLIHIKSKLLLPPDPVLPGEEIEDPRAELVQQLIEHEKFKNAAQMLHQKQTVQAAMWSNPALGSFTEGQEEQGLAVTLIDLVKAFQQVLERAKEKPLLAIEGEKVSVAEMMQRLCELLSTGPPPLALEALFRHLRSRDALLAAFLALLELVRLQAVVVRQNELFGAIVLYKHKMFDVVFAQRQREIDKDYE